MLLDASETGVSGIEDIPSSVPLTEVVTGLKSTGFLSSLLESISKVEDALVLPCIVGVSSEGDKECTHLKLKGYNTKIILRFEI